MAANRAMPPAYQLKCRWRLNEFAPCQDTKVPDTSTIGGPSRPHPLQTRTPLGALLHWGSECGVCICRIAGGAGEETKARGTPRLGVTPCVAQAPRSMQPPWSVHDNLKLYNEGADNACMCNRITRQWRSRWGDPTRQAKRVYRKPRSTQRTPAGIPSGNDEAQAG